MQGRKKSSKSASKRSQDSASKPKNGSVLAFLKQKATPFIETPEGGSLTAEVLEVLLEKDSIKLDSLLAQWGHDGEAVQYVAEHLVESKIPLFAQKLTELLEKDQGKLYLYPWLVEVYARYHNKVEEEISERLRNTIVINAGQTEKFIKLEAKFGLILQQ